MSGAPVITIRMLAERCEFSDDGEVISYSMGADRWREWLKSMEAAVAGMDQDGWPVRGSG